MTDSTMTPQMRAELEAMAKSRQMAEDAPVHEAGMPVALAPYSDIILQEGADGGPRIGKMLVDTEWCENPDRLGQIHFRATGVRIEWSEHVQPQDIILGAMLRIHYYQKVDDGKWAHPKNAEAMDLLSIARNDLMPNPMGPPIFDYGKDIIDDEMVLRKIEGGGTVQAGWRNFHDDDNNPAGGIFEINVYDANPHSVPVKVEWQAGPTKVSQQSGAFIEDLLIAAVIRLTQFNPQETYKDVPSEYCNRAAAKCLEAIAALQDRRAEREAAGKWGTNEV